MEYSTQGCVYLSLIVLAMLEIGIITLMVM
jgi:hypothetical protein